MKNMKPPVFIKNHKLRTERKLQGWSQAKLAKVLGVTTRTVICWEQGLAVPQPNYRKKLGAIFGKTAQELGLLWDTNENYTVQKAPPSQPLQMFPHKCHRWLTLAYHRRSVRPRSLWGGQVC